MRTLPQGCTIVSWLSPPLSSSVTSDSLQPYGLKAALSMGFSRQEYWSGLPFPPLGDLSHPGTELTSLSPPELAGRFFTASATWKAPCPCIPSLLWFLLFSQLRHLSFLSAQHFKFYWLKCVHFCVNSYDGWNVSFSGKSYMFIYKFKRVMVQSLSCVWLFVTPLTAAYQASLSFAIEFAQAHVHWVGNAIHWIATVWICPLNLGKVLEAEWNLFSTNKKWGTQFLCPGDPKGPPCEEEKLNFT